MLEIRRMNIIEKSVAEMLNTIPNYVLLVAASNTKTTEEV